MNELSAPGLDAPGPGKPWSPGQCQAARAALAAHEGALTQRTWEAFRRGCLAPRSAGAIQHHVMRSCRQCKQAYRAHLRSLEQDRPPGPEATSQLSQSELARLLLQLGSETTNR